MVSFVTLRGSGVIVMFGKDTVAEEDLWCVGRGRGGMSGRLLSPPPPSPPPPLRTVGVGVFVVVGRTLGVIEALFDSDGMPPIVPVRVVVGDGVFVGDGLGEADTVVVGENDGVTEAVSQDDNVGVGDAVFVSEIEMEGVPDNVSVVVVVGDIVPVTDGSEFPLVGVGVRDRARPVGDADAVGRPHGAAPARPAAPRVPSTHEHRTVRLRVPRDCGSTHDVQGDIWRARQMTGLAGGSEQSAPP
jgi:hypothetical protein